MPCRYDPTPEEIAADRLARENRVKAEKEKAKIRKRELDLATALLCGVCRRLEDGTVGFKVASEIMDDPELAAWWKRHKVADEKRLARDAEKRRRKEEKRKAKEAKRKLKESAIAKLTDAERKALGL